MSKIFILVLLAFSLPVKLLAATIINEVAWMGDVSSANHEWIELYNTSTESVSVDNWTISDGANLSITLSGVIGAGSYAVLERTGDESASGSAFLIYTGALVNSGATLILRDHTGTIMDQVAGGENWQEIGGDNVTKETAQYTNRGWVTAPATPGMNNSAATTDSNSAGGTQTASTTTYPVHTVAENTITKSTGSKSTVRLGTQQSVLKVIPDVQAVAYVNQTIPFTVSASGVGDTIAKSLVHTWNFGDSYTATGSSVSHYYSFPGTYVVTVRSRYAKHDETARHEVTVLPTTFSITTNNLGDVQIHNDAPYDIDISGYTVRGQKEIVLPPRSHMVARGTLTIANKRLYTTGSDPSIVLNDTKGVTVATLNRDYTSLPVVAEGVISEVTTSVLPMMIAASETVVTDGVDVASSTPDESKIFPEPKNTQLQPPARWPYMILLLVLVGTVVLVFAKKDQ